MLLNNINKLLIQWVMTFGSPCILFRSPVITAQMVESCVLFGHSYLGMSPDFAFPFPAMYYVISRLSLHKIQF